MLKYKRSDGKTINLECDEALLVTKTMGESKITMFRHNLVDSSYSAHRPKEAGLGG